MYVGLREASFSAVGSASGDGAGKNGYRNFGFRSTTPIFAENRHAATPNGLARGLARRQRSGHLQYVLLARRGELQPEQRPSSACRRVPAVGQFSQFLLTVA
jgi:hypothetical protein